MIRRHATTAAGSPGWILIPQIAHARLAADLADHWDYGPYLAASSRRPRPSTGAGETVDLTALVTDVRLAVRIHDDGWREWDDHPGLNEQGVPLAFDEMPLAESLAIWRRSIQLALARSSLAGFLVAGHFSRLLLRFDSWRGSPDKMALARQFLKDFAALGADQDAAEVMRAERGVGVVQMFDAISLWLACAERTEPWQTSLPSGGSWTFTPLDTGAAGQRIALDPWPFGPPDLPIAVTGRRVPQAVYESTDALLAAAGNDVEMRWLLVPQ